MANALLFYERCVQILVLVAFAATAFGQNANENVDKLLGEKLLHDLEDNTAPAAPAKAPAPAPASGPGSILSNNMLMFLLSTSLVSACVQTSWHKIAIVHYAGKSCRTLPSVAMTIIQSTETPGTPIEGIF